MAASADPGARMAPRRGQDFWFTVLFVNNWLFGCGLVGLLVVSNVPLFMSLLAMLGLCCFLRVTLMIHTHTHPCAQRTAFLRAVIMVYNACGQCACGHASGCHILEILVDTDTMHPGRHIVAAK